MSECSICSRERAATYPVTLQNELTGEVCSDCL